MEAAQDYTPTRASDRTERKRLLAKIADLKSRLEAQSQRSEISADPSYARSAHNTARELDKARERLQQFDAAQQELDAAAASDAATAARKRAARAAEKFEKALDALRVATVELLDALAELSKASGARVGYWPHAHQTVAAVTKRAHDVLNGAGLKFDPHSPRPGQSNIADKFNGEA